MNYKKRARTFILIGGVTSITALILIGIFYGWGLAGLLFAAITGANLEQRGKIVDIISKSVNLPGTPTDNKR